MPACLSYPDTPPGAVKVHYFGWNVGYDEWVSIEDAKDGEGDEVNVGEEKEKEKVEEGEENRPSPEFEETPLSAACLKIRMLEMKSKEIERKKEILALEIDENACELEAEKEKLKTILEEESDSSNPQSQILRNICDLGGTKNGTSGTQTKIRDHFYKPNTSPKPGKNHLRIAFLSLESDFLAISFILHILSRF